MLAVQKSPALHVFKYKPSSLTYVCTCMVHKKHVMGGEREGRRTITEDKNIAVVVLCFKKTISDNEIVVLLTYCTVYFTVKC